MSGHKSYFHLSALNGAIQDTYGAKYSSGGSVIATAGKGRFGGYGIYFPAKFHSSVNEHSTINFPVGEIPSMDFGTGDYTIAYWAYTIPATASSGVTDGVGGVYHYLVSTQWPSNSDLEGAKIVHQHYHANTKDFTWSALFKSLYNRQYSMDSGGRTDFYPSHTGYGFLSQKYFNSMNTAGKYNETQTWNHVAYTRENGIARMFWNGNLIQTITQKEKLNFNKDTGVRFGGPWYRTSQNDLFYGYLDDFSVIKGKALWTKTFKPPSTYLFDLIRRKYAYANQTGIYGINGAGAFEKLGERWDDTLAGEREGIFENVGYEQATVGDLAELGEFKIVIYSSILEDEIKCEMTVVPKDQLVLPKGLIDLSEYEGIDRAKVKYAATGNGMCRILATTDLAAYQTYDFAEETWKPIDHTDLEAVKASGIEAAQLADIPRPAWDVLGAEKIGFAYLLSVEHSSDTCAVDELALQIDMKGRWEKAVHREDYTYGYAGNDTLRVELLTDGSYKINYI